MPATNLALAAAPHAVECGRCKPLQADPGAQPPNPNLATFSPSFPDCLKTRRPLPSVADPRGVPSDYLHSPGQDRLSPIVTILLAS